MRDGSCAEAAINAASSRLSSSTDFPKYTSAADSTPYALFPKKNSIYVKRKNFFLGSLAFKLKS